MTWSRSYNWFVTPQNKNNLGEGFQINSGPQQYNVQLIRNCNCCSETYQILVNNQPIQHELYRNIWSPLCCPGGEYGWEQDGHHFLLMYNCLTLLRSMGHFALFVDGVEVDTGLNFRAYWRRKGLQFAIIGIVFFLIGAVLGGVMYFVVSSNLNRGIFVGFGFMGAGLVYIFMGLIPVFRKFDSPRYHHGTVIYNKL